MHAAAWHRISDTEPIGPLAPRLWSPIAPLFKTILSGQVNGAWKSQQPKRK